MSVNRFNIKAKSVKNVPVTVDLRRACDAIPTNPLPRILTIASDCIPTPRAVPDVLREASHKIDNSFRSVPRRVFSPKPVRTPVSWKNCASANVSNCSDVLMLEFLSIK